MVTSYLLELDGSLELEPYNLQFYQELIGMLQWATELSRVDILNETSFMSQYQASPRDGQLEQVLHIFSFLKKKPKLKLYMDPSLPRMDYSVFKTKPEDFKEYYRDAEEEMQHRMPRPRGMTVATTAFMESSHGSNKVTRRYHSGHILFVNLSPVNWLIRRQ